MQIEQFLSKITSNIMNGKDCLIQELKKIENRK